MSQITARYSLPYLPESPANPETVHNESLDLISQFVGLFIIDRNLTTPPAIANGETYLVATGATGAWAGQDGKLAHGINEAWVFTDNVNGTPFFVEDEGGGGIYLNGYNFRSLAPRVALRRTSVLSLSGETNVGWNSQIVIDGHFTHSTSTNSDRINVSGDGLHEITCVLTFDRTAGSGEQVVRIRFYDQTTIIPGAEFHFAFDAATASCMFTRIQSTTGSYVRVTAELISGGGTVRIASTGSFLKICRP